MKLCKRLFPSKFEAFEQCRTKKPASFIKEKNNPCDFFIFLNLTIMFSFRPNYYQNLKIKIIVYLLGQYTYKKIASHTLKPKKVI